VAELTLAVAVVAAEQELCLVALAAAERVLRLVLVLPLEA